LLNFLGTGIAGPWTWYQLNC